MTPHESTARAIRRVLVIFPGALGDLICLLPALAAIARRHAPAAVDLMARLEIARLAAGRTVVARAHSIDAREMGALFTDTPAVDPDARRFFAGFDRIYSFFASDDARFRARIRAATDAEISFHPFHPAGDGHVSAAYLRAIGCELDAAASPIYPRLEPTADDLAAATDVLRQSKCAGSNLILIFPGSGSPAKNWPADKFAALASMLSKRITWPSIPADALCVAAPEKSVAVILGPAETSIEPAFRDLRVAAPEKRITWPSIPADALCVAAREKSVPVLKDLDLPTVAALARLASAFVGNDSGVSHMAAAVGTPGVVLFGPTDPARWAPIPATADSHIVILSRTPIASIAPAEVTSALDCLMRSTLRAWRMRATGELD
jgi:heptosyltransferase-2